MTVLARTQTWFAEFTGSTPEIFTPVNGLTVKVMALVFRHALTEALMSENSSLVSNMDLVLTTSGNKKSIFRYNHRKIFCLIMSELWLFLVEEMEISTQESTLETRFMGLVFTISLMVTITKELGTKVVSNAMARMDL